MGLIWSQKQEPGQKSGRRLVKLDVTTPITNNLFVLSDFVVADDCLHAIAKEQWLACAQSERLHMAEGVQRIEVKDKRLFGTLFIPNGPGPFPGVIDLFGGKGGITEHRSAMLASRGIASFALGYFRSTDLPFPKVLEIEYFEEAIEYLLKHPKVKKPYAGIIGVSLGAQIALLTSSLCHQIKACIEINGSPITTVIGNTYKNEQFPAAEFSDEYKMIDEEGSESYMFSYYPYNLQGKYQHIPVERGQCEYLLIHCGDDQTVPALAAASVPERLKEHNKTNYRVLLYPGAGHLLEPPHSPNFFMTYQPVTKTNLLWGGHPRQHARAQEDAWKQVLKFFKDIL